MIVSILETVTVTKTSSAALYLLSPSKESVIIASPSPTATTLPSSSTVTTELLEEVKVIFPASIGFNLATIVSSSPTNKSNESSPLRLITVSIIETFTDTVTSSAALYISLPLKLIMTIASPSPIALTFPSSSTSTTSSESTLNSKELERSKGLISEPSSITMHATILFSSPTINFKVSLLISSIRTSFLETMTVTVTFSAAAYL